MTWQESLFFGALEVEGMTKEVKELIAHANEVIEKSKVHKTRKSAQETTR